MLKFRIFGSQQAPLHYESPILEQSDNGSKLPFLKIAETLNLPKFSRWLAIKF